MLKYFIAALIIGWTINVLRKQYVRYEKRKTWAAMARNHHGPGIRPQD